MKIPFVLLISVMFALSIFSFPVLAGCPCAASQEQTCDSCQGQPDCDCDAPQAMLLSNAKEIGDSLVKAVNMVTGSKMIRGVAQKIAPKLTTLNNRTVLELNNTERIEITKDLVAKIRPVISELDHIQINGTPLISHNVTNPEVKLPLLLRIRNRTMERNMTVIMSQSRNMLNITVRNATAFTDAEIIYDNGTVFIFKLNKSAELKTLPDMAKEKIQEKFQNRTEVKEMLLKLENNRARYSIKTMTKKRIFGLFDVDVEEQTELDADTGEIENTTGPWWSFLAWN